MSNKVKITIRLGRNDCYDDYFNEYEEPYTTKEKLEVAFWLVMYVLFVMGFSYFMIN